MTLTKANIIDSIYNSTDLNRSQATKAVKTLLESIKTTLRQPLSPAKISLFLVSGSFVLRKRRSGEAGILRPGMI